MPEDPNRQTEWALWRYSILGPLVSARLAHGDRIVYLRAAAERQHVDPDGHRAQLSVRTLEGWYYAWRKGGLAALERAPRSDRNRTSISPQLQERLTALKMEKPRRSIRRLIKILERLGEVKPNELSRSSLQRFLKSRGLSGRGAVAEPVERRAFRHRHAGDLWMGDVLHGPRVIWKGQVRKSYLIAFIDSATRFVPAAELRLSESAIDHEAALKQAVLKHGRPRALYLDNGAAQRATSLRTILAGLGIRLIHTRAYDPQAKAGIERWNRTWREEVESELPEEPLPLEEVQSRSWSWLAVEYNARVHSATRRTPLEAYLEDRSVLRPIPRDCDIDAMFLHRATRVVRADGAVRFRGQFLEVRSSLIGETVELRFDPSDDAVRPRVYLNGTFVCDTVAQDLVGNALRKRHRPKGTAPSAPRTGVDPLALMQDEQARRGTPPPSDPPPPNPDETENPL